MSKAFSQSENSRSREKQDVTKVAWRLGESMTQYAKRHGVGIAHLSNVVAGRRRSRRLHWAIAASVGSRPHKLWPWLYSQDDEYDFDFHGERA